MKRTGALLLCVLFLGLLTGVVHGQSGPRGEWMAGYVKMEKADKAMTSGSSSDALGLYREALEVFERVRRKYPSWNSALLNYRINYCKEQIEKLGKTVGKESSSMGKESLQKLAKEQYTTITKLSDERKTLQSRVEVLTEALERARGEAARNASIETSLAETTRVNGELKEQVRLLELKLADSVREVERLKAKAGLADQLKRVEEDMKLVNEQLVKSQNSLTEARLEHEKLVREGKQQKMLLEGVTRERDDLNTALKVVRELSTARKKENEVLRARFTTVEQRVLDLEGALKIREEELSRRDARLKQVVAEMDELRNLKAVEAEAGRKAQVEELKSLRGTLEQLSVLEEGKQGSANAIARRRMLEDLATSLEAKDVELSRLAKQMASLFADRERLMALEEELAGVRRDLESERGESKRQRAQALTSQENAMALRGEFERVSAQLATAEKQCTALAVQLEDLRKGRLAQRQETGLKTEEMQSMQDRLTASENGRKQVEAQLTAQVALAGRLETEAKGLRERVQALETARVEREKAFEASRKSLGVDVAKAQAETLYERERLSLSEKQKTSLEGTVAALETDLKKSREQVRQLREQLSGSDAALSELQKAYERLMQRGAAGEAADKLTAQAEAHRKESQAFANLESMLQAQSGKLGEHEKTLRALKEQYDVRTAELLAAEKAQSEQKSRIAALETKISGLEEELKMVGDQLAASKKEASGLEDSMGEMRAKVVSLEAEKRLMADKVGVVDGMTSVVASVQEEIEKGEAIRKRLRQQVAVYESQLREAQVKIRDLEKTAKDMASKGDDAVAQRMQDLQDKLTAAETRVRALESVLSDGDMSSLPKAMDESQAVRENVALKKMNEALSRQNKLLQDQSALQSERLAQSNKRVIELERTSGGATAEGAATGDKALANERAARVEAESRAMTAEVRVQASEAQLATLQAQIDLLKAGGATANASEGTAPSARAERERRDREREALVKGYVRQGLDAERQGKVEAARWNYEKVLSMDSSNKVALQQLGQLAYKAGDDATAIKYLKRAFYHDPDDSKTLFALGFSYARQNQPDWAVSMMGRAVALNPDDAAMARVYGATLVQLGWSDAGEREFRRALKLNPKEKDAAFNLAVLLMSSASETGRGMTFDTLTKLREKAGTSMKQLSDASSAKSVQACVEWLTALSKPALNRFAEAKKWYDEAKKLGVEPDPALEAVLNQK